MTKYSKKAQNKIEEVMHEFNEGTLNSGKKAEMVKLKAENKRLLLE